MTVTIPFSVEDTAQDCIIELRDLAQENVLAEIYHAYCEPGIHSVEFDPLAVEGGLEAGVYLISLTIGDHTEVHPLQYMP